MKQKDDFDWTIVLAPFNEDLPAQKRTEVAIELSELVLRIATHIICHTIVEREELFKKERTAIAHAFLQRETSTHMCNHKLTTEGLVYHYNEQAFQLHEEYKTMTLTRSAYEHLAMFYFLYEHPKTEEERNVVWKYWKSNNRKNGSIEVLRVDGKLTVRQVPFSQAWKYLYRSEEMAMLYRHLSMHCHPVYSGLVQYQNQTLEDQGEDAIPLHLSSSFLAYMCKMFLKLIPQGEEILKHDFTPRELFIFRALSQYSSNVKDR